MNAAVTGRKYENQASSRAPAPTGRWAVCRPALFLAAILALTLVPVSPAEAFVYWPESPVGSRFDPLAIGRANPDGTLNPDFLPLPPVHEDQMGNVTVEGASGVAVDAAHVYWISGSGGIGRANLDGRGASQNFIPLGRIARPCDLAVDDSHAYWTEATGTGTGTIRRASLDGRGADPGFITGASPCGSVAVDDAHVYWNSFDQGAETIARANLDGTGVDHGFLAPPGGGCGVAVDASHLYWASVNFETGFGAIGRANLDGTGVDPSFIPDAGGCDLAVDGGHIYWATGYTIGRASLDGTGADRSFIPNAGEFAFSVAVDALRSFGFGALKHNKRRGTAKLTASVPAAGNLKLARTKTVRGAKEVVATAGKVTLPIRPRGKAKEKLEQIGKPEKRRKRTSEAKVNAKVTYTPASGDPNVVASTDTVALKLIKRGLVGRAR